MTQRQQRPLNLLRLIKIPDGMINAQLYQLQNSRPEQSKTDMYMEKTAHYHNTNRLEGTELVDADDKALHMEERIWRFLKKYAGREYTPWEINDFFPEYLIGSIRRALT